MRAKLLKKINDKRISNIEKSIGQLASVLDVASITKLEKRIVSQLILLSPNFKTENSDILQPLHLYFFTLHNRGRISIDKTAENPSIELFTDCFLNNKEVLLGVFETPKLQKVILALIMANLSIHRFRHAEKILNEFNSIFSETYKAMLYVKILTAPCGVLPVNMINDLFSKSKETIGKLNNLESIADYLRNLILISEGVQINIPDISQILNDFTDKCEGKQSPKVKMLFRELLLNNKDLEFVEKWLETLDNKEGADNGIKELRYILDKRKANQNRILLFGKDFKPDNNYDINTSMEKVYIDRHYSDKNYSREQLNKDVQASIDYYHDKSQNASSIDGKINSGSVYYELKLLSPTIKLLTVLERSIDKVRRAFDKEDKNKVFVFVNEYSHVNTATTIPFLLEAERRGIRCYSFSSKIHLDRCNEDDPWYYNYGFVNDGRDSRFYPNNNIDDADVDIPNKRIIVRGMNIYQPIFEFVTRYQFTYFFKYNDDAWARFRTTLLIRKFIALFDYIQDIEKWATDNNTKVYFISNAPHIHNAAAFRIYCEEKNDENMLAFICTSFGYDNYFLNSTDPKSITTTAINMTKNRNVRNSFLGTKEGFEKYYEINFGRVAEVRKKMDQYLKMNRGQKKNNKGNINKKEEIIKRIIRDRNEGKKIVLLNGKVIFDLGVKYTKGVCHSDMSEWITHAYV